MRENFYRDSAIFDVSRCELDMDGISKGIHHRMYLGAPSTTAYSDLLVLEISLLPFFAPALA